MRRQRFWHGGCRSNGTAWVLTIVYKRNFLEQSRIGSTVVGCVLLTPGLDELAEAGNKIVKSADFLSKAAGWVACALNAEDFIDALNGVSSGKANPDQIGKSIESLGGCVGDALGQMIAKE